MKGARAASPPVIFALLALTLAFLLTLLPASGQARPARDEITVTPPPTETESPPPTSPSQPTDFPTQTALEQTLLLVGLSQTTSAERFEQNIPYPMMDVGLSMLGIYAVQVPQAQSSEIMEWLASLPGARYAEPDYTVTAQDTLPNDPGVPFQYALVNIRALQGWDLTTGSSAVTIAIVDSGVDLTHPELAPKLLAGYDFVNGDSIPQDDNGHGTHVAGIAAAASNNGLGIAGVSWGARILPVKVLNASNTGTYSNVAAGIVWAADQGANIINLSLGGASPSLTLESAVNYAAARGVLMSAAAGNTGGAVLYPARYPAVIAVASTNAANLRAPTSAFGPEIDLAAPGVGIYSLAPGGGYATLNGTSMAAPHVSGALALLLSMPGVGPTQARSYLETTALDLDAPGWDVFTGYGLIQLDTALALAIPTATPTVTFVPSLTAVSGSKPTSAPGLPPVLNATFTPLPMISTNAPSSAITPTVCVTPTETTSPMPDAALTRTPTITFTPPSAQSPAKAGRAVMPCLGILLVLLGLLLAALMRYGWQKSTN